MKFSRISIFFLTLAMLCFGTVLFSQIAEHTVILKNGSVIKGKVELLIPDEIVKIRVDENNLLEFKWEQIASVHIGEVPKPDPGIQYETRKKYRVVKDSVYFPKRGVYTHLEFAVLFSGNSTSTNSAATVSANVVVGYRIFPQLQVGLGLGADRYVFDATLNPIYLDVRGDFYKGRKTTPYYFMQAGYGFNWLTGDLFYEEYNGGMMYYGGLGVKVYTRRKSQFSFGMGFKSQKAHRQWTEFNWNTGLEQTINQTIKFQRISMLTAITF